jgi:monoterpene epsilon-lactone hydrolase
VPRLVPGPSLTHRVLAHVIPVVRRSGEVEDADALRRDILARQADVETAPSSLLVRGCDVTTLQGTDFPVFDLRARGTSPERTVLYLHGGGFVSGIDRFHWRYAASLARATGARIVVPAYPLTPRHTWRDCHAALLDLFERLAIESPGGAALMGDSAGGGLALTLAQQVARRPGPQPTHLVLVSPWVDLVGSTPGTSQAAARDRWLTLSKLRLYGSWWAGDDDPARPEVSPLHGNYVGLPRTLVMCGTRDLLLPQVREAVRRATAAGVPVTYREEPDLIHVYPVLPVPEAKPALRDVARFLGG